MMTDTAPAVAPRRVLLIKAQGQFKHSGKYYLHNGRWHALHQDKPAPKGAPVAAHKHAAGQYVPKQHFTDDEWKQLELPAENTNAGSFNKLLGQLKQYSDAGDVTAILGMGLGTNTYGKKAAAIANHLLDLYGSEHKVSAGQKAGEHAAVQQAPADAPAPAKAEQPAPAAAEPDAVAKFQAFHEKQGTPSATVDGKDWFVVAIGATDQDGKVYAHLASKTAGAVQKNGFVPKQMADWLEPSQINDPKKAAAAAASEATGLAMPAFVEGKTTNGVVAYYTTQAQKVLDLAAAGDAAGLEAMKADGLKPKKNGKPSNTWAGKTQNSKLLLATHQQAMAKVQGGAQQEPTPAAEPSKPDDPHAVGKMTRSIQNAIAEAIEEEDETSLKYFVSTYAAGTPVHNAAKVALAELEKKAATPEPVAPAAPASQPSATSKLSQIPWDSQLLPDSNTNAKSHNGKVAQIKAMAEAGDLAGLEAFKAGKNTYGQKQMKLAALAVAALKEDAAEQAPAAATESKQVNASHENEAEAPLASQVKPVKPPVSSPVWEPVVSDIESAIEEGNADFLQSTIAGNAGMQAPAAKMAVAYAQAGLAYLNEGGVPDTGPKDGDTKQGADGMLVFKNGRWHKQGEPTSAEKAAILAWLAAPEAEDHLHEEAKQAFKGLSKEHQQAITIESLQQQKAAEKPAAAAPVVKKLKPSEAIALGKPFKTASGMKATLKGMAVAGDVEGLKEFIDKHPNLHASKKYAQALIDAMTSGEPDAPAAPKPPKTTAAPHADQNAIESVDSWEQTGPQGGSNPGGKFVDEQGTEWYCKFPGNEDVAKSEVLAAKLYQALGIAGQDAKLVTKDGKLGIASKWQDVKKASSPAELAKVDGVASGFAADAWLGNWDVVGMGYDNLQIDATTGKAMRVDAGGSLQYRAQGGKKDFGNVVSEIDSLRDPKINPHAAAVFGKLNNADITAGVAKVLKISDAQIHALVNTYGPGDAAHKKALAETLIARKADLLAKFPKAKKEKKATFKPEKISEPPSFMNWGGSGKDGPSSKSFLNKANEEAVQAIYAAAKSGSIEAIQKLEADVYNKETGAVTGKAPVLSHPSQHVKGYAQQAVNEINYQMNPPKRFRFEGGHPLATLNSAYPAHKGPPHSAAVETAGKFLVLGEPGKISIESLALPKTTYASGALTKATYSPQAKAAIGKMPETQKQAIKQYTGSSYVGMNTSLWSGNPSGAAKAAAEALHTNSHDIAPGTVLSRKLTVHGSGLDEILKSTGKVLQEPAIMSTSIRPSSWSGNVHLKLHVGPGVKGLWVGVGSTGSGSALSVNSSEDELILPPNTRIMVLSVKPSKGGDADGFGTGSSHIVEAIVLPTQSHA